jgi:hypothetical protein
VVQEEVEEVDEVMDQMLVEVEVVVVDLLLLRVLTVLVMITLRKVEQEVVMVKGIHLHIHTPHITWWCWWFNYYRC